MSRLGALIAGLIFALGLAISGMTQPSKVVGFLDVSGGAWDPSLGLVMAGALAVYGLAYRMLRGRASPWLADEFKIPDIRELSPRLIGGAVLFGAGWAVGGFCPGPAVVSLPTGTDEARVFLACMILGMVLFQLPSYLPRQDEAEPHIDASMMQ